MLLQYSNNFKILIQYLFRNEYMLYAFFFFVLFLRVYKRYRAICPEVVPKKMTGDEPVKIRVPQERIEQLPELKVFIYEFTAMYFINYYLLDTVETSNKSQDD